MFNLWKKKKSSINLDDLIKKAEENNIKAQYELSLIYYKGEIVKKDIKKSSYWFERANKTLKKEGMV
jgi:TPR repeat protein